jgi:predicted transcriptional regulator
MSVTTIKVDSAVRDRLAGIARARGTTMGALLEQESRRLEVEQHWSEIEAAHRRMQLEDPGAWGEYISELTEVTTGEPDTSAAEEWPEYNG